MIITDIPTKENAVDDRKMTPKAQATSSLTCLFLVWFNDHVSKAEVI